MARTQHWKPAAVRQAAIERAHRTWMIEQGDEPTVRDLTESVGVDPSTISLQLKRMRARGLELPTRGYRPGRRCPYFGEEL
ncbi:MarR family transcriptional regulator [Streptomyces sp. SID14478]|uniref:helix-turn-helix domain-containing protein n=1 Tax=Streptomyces sp. SID14478 TaxID=2706073 RepID=UPI0013DB7094|nr:helix-turn-helix domain-containing protein [Streptomyces sp. SID14478]NEB77584.1 MarR family transcriptional regulator [Streptomyces sp. SID14478]